MWIVVAQGASPEAPADVGLDLDHTSADLVEEGLGFLPAGLGLGDGPPGRRFLLLDGFWLHDRGLVFCFGRIRFGRTKAGRYIYAVGGNSQSAYETGINTAWVQMRACMINSVFIFLTALFFVGQNRSGDARMGDPLTLKAIAAAVVGGIALTGGRGSVYFALIGALIFSFVSKIIFFANIPNAYQTLFGGVIVIVAIAASQLATLSGRRAGQESKLT